MALIDNINWRGLDRLVLRQQRNRAAHAPVISLFRWWARRPHCFAGALLEAAQKEFSKEEDFLVADPFSGGGTVAFEAARRGLRVYAQDLYPWPSMGLATALTPADPNEFRRAATRLLEILQPYRKRYWTENGGTAWETTHIIRVRASACPKCLKRLFLFREPLVSIASRRGEESFGFFGCSACGAVSRRKRNTRAFRCDACNRHSRAAGHVAPSPKPEVLCPRCNESAPLADLLSSSPEWKPVLLREQVVKKSEESSRLRVVRHDDRLDESPSLQAHRPHTEIPDGIETASLKRYGFSVWEDLYTQTQLDIIKAALCGVSSIDASKAVADHLRLAILGSTEMAGYVCRWERYNPKALEAIANHRFSRSTVTVETNLLSTSGRGTLPRRFEAAERALRWMQAEGYPTRTSRAEASSRRRSVSGALVVTGSSERQLLPSGAAQLVFTDPPYHDDLQYGELARLFHFWMKSAGYLQEPLEEQEAVPNSVRGVTTKHYEDKVTACLTESNRVLASNGRLVLTFHNRDMNAWEALANALERAGFDVVGLAAVAAENPADHSKRGKQSLLSDLVIECLRRRKNRRPNVLTVRGIGHGSEMKNLHAIGLALAECVNRREGRIEALFEENAKRLKCRKILIRRGGR
jgi:putative DNA methylase